VRIRFLSIITINDKEVPVPDERRVLREPGSTDMLPKPNSLETTVFAGLPLVYSISNWDRLVEDHVRQLCEQSSGNVSKVAASEKPEQYFIVSTCAEYLLANPFLCSQKNHFLPIYAFWFLVLFFCFDHS
jgi:hypothetical protein